MSQASQTIGKKGAGEWAVDVCSMKPTVFWESENVSWFFANVKPDKSITISVAPSTLPGPWKTLNKYLLVFALPLYG